MGFWPFKNKGNSKSSSANHNGIMITSSDYTGTAQLERLKMPNTLNSSTSSIGSNSQSPSTSSMITFPTTPVQSRESKPRMPLSTKLKRLSLKQSPIASLSGLGSSLLRTKREPEYDAFLGDETLSDDDDEHLALVTVHTGVAGAGGVAVVHESRRMKQTSNFKSADHLHSPPGPFLYTANNMADSNVDSNTPTIPISSSSRPHTNLGISTSPAKQMNQNSPRYGSASLPSPSPSLIFERNVQDLASPDPYTQKIPSHYASDDFIPPVLTASTEALANDIDPEQVLVVQTSIYRPASVRSTSQRSSVTTNTNNNNNNNSNINSNINSGAKTPTYPPLPSRSFSVSSASSAALFFSPSDNPNLLPSPGLSPSTSAARKSLLTHGLESVPLPALAPPLPSSNTRSPSSVSYNSISSPEQQFALSSSPPPQSFSAGSTPASPRAPSPSSARTTPRVKHSSSFSTISSHQESKDTSKRQNLRVLSFCSFADLVSTENVAAAAAAAAATTTAGASPAAANSASSSASAQGNLQSPHQLAYGSPSSSFSSHQYMSSPGSKSPSRVSKAASNLSLNNALEYRSRSTASSSVSPSTPPTSAGTATSGYFSQGATSYATSADAKDLRFASSNSSPSKKHPYDFRDSIDPLESDEDDEEDDGQYYFDAKARLPMPPAQTSNLPSEHNTEIDPEHPPGASSPNSLPTQGLRSKKTYSMQFPTQYPFGIITATESYPSLDASTETFASNPKEEYSYSFSNAAHDGSEEDENFNDNYQPGLSNGSTGAGLNGVSGGLGEDDYGIEFSSLGETLRRTTDDICSGNVNSSASFNMMAANTQSSPSMAPKPEGFALPTAYTSPSRSSSFAGLDQQNSPVPQLNKGMSSLALNTPNTITPTSTTPSQQEKNPLSPVNTALSSPAATFLSSPKIQQSVSFDTASEKEIQVPGSLTTA